MVYHKRGREWLLHSRCWPVEEPSLNDWESEPKGPQKGYETQTEVRGLGVLFLRHHQAETLASSITSHRRKPQILCFCLCIGTVTNSYYTPSSISLITSPSLKEITKRAEANNPGMQVIVYLCSYLAPQLPVPKAFPEELQKSNAN